MSQLQVNVICCRNLPEEWFGSLDAYVVLKYGGRRHNTSIKRDSGKDPNFFETIVLALHDPPGAVKVRVYDKDRVADDFKGKCTIEVEELLASRSRTRASFPLRNRLGMRNAGEIELEFIVL